MHVDVNLTQDSYKRRLDPSLKVTDLIRVYDNFIPSDQCDMMVDWYESNPSLQEEGCVLDGLTGNSHTNTSFKVCKESTVDRQDILDILSESSFGVYEEAFKSGLPFPDLDRYQLCLNGYTIRRYNKNEGVFKPHIDQHSGSTQNRLFGIVIYLNDVDEGGETEFPEWDISVSPKKGRILLFPCNFLFLHQANVPISHDKYSATMFINFMVTK